MSELVCLAKVVAAHGIKGEVKLKSWTLDPKDVCAYGKLLNKDGSKTFSCRVTGLIKGLVRVKIDGVDTRNDAEALVGTELYVPRQMMPKLQENTFYQADLVGLRVLSVNGLKELGRIVGIYNFGAGDILEIKYTDIKETEMIPFTNMYVSEVNIEKGYISVKLESMPYMKDEEISNES